MYTVQSGNRVKKTVMDWKGKHQETKKKISGHEEGIGVKQFIKPTRLRPHAKQKTRQVTADRKPERPKRYLNLFLAISCQLAAIVGAL
jgi:hypothetical protein